MASRNSFTTSKNNTYSYLHIPPSTLRQTLLFIHGFPSHAEDWTQQIDCFSKLGYGVLAPDMLGYGHSSKTTDISHYRIKAQSSELVELLDHLGLETVVGVGHDTGAALLSRLAAYFPGRFAALVFLAVGPPALGTPFDIESINTMTKEMMGYELLGYIPWLGGEGTDAQETLEKHPEAAMSLLFAANEDEAWSTWFRPLDKMSQFVREDRRVEIGDWYPPELRHKHLDAFGREGGYAGAVRWYNMWLNNLSLPDEEGYEDVKLTQPVLLILPPGQRQQEEMLAAWMPNFSITRLAECGHWVHLKKSEETNEMISEFLNGLGRT